MESLTDWFVLDKSLKDLKMTRDLFPVAVDACCDFEKGPQPLVTTKFVLLSSATGSHSNQAYGV